MNLRQLREAVNAFAPINDFREVFIEIDDDYSDITGVESEEYILIKTDYQTPCDGCYPVEGNQELSNLLSVAIQWYDETTGNGDITRLANLATELVKTIGDYKKANP